MTTGNVHPEECPGTFEGFADDMQQNAIELREQGRHREASAQIKRARRLRRLAQRYAVGFKRARIHSKQ